jgi:hypothetical protein
MEKMNDRTSRYRESQSGLNFEDWDFCMDLDFSWTGILRSLIKVILKKLSSFPRPVRQGSAMAERG